MNRLDLHGFKHIEVPRILEQFIYDHMNRDSKEIEVVTGNSTRMKSIVKEIVDDYGMEITELWGNNGTMVIKLV
jgi:DNA-nicking Smr family endonuclease